MALPNSADYQTFILKRILPLFKVGLITTSLAVAGFSYHGEHGHANACGDHSNGCSNVGHGNQPTSSNGRYGGGGSGGHDEHHNNGHNGNNGNNGHGGSHGSSTCHDTHGSNNQPCHDNPPPCDNPPPHDNPPPCDNPPPHDNPPPNNPPDNSHGNEAPSSQEQDQTPNFEVSPLFFIDGLKSRIITDDDQEHSGRTSSIMTPANGQDLFKVEDFKEGMLFIGAIATVSIIPAGALDGAGIGLVALVEGNSHSTRRVFGLDIAQKIPALKRPKEAHHMKNWRIGDSLSYSMAVGAMAPLGAGIAVIGVGFAPIVDGRWRVTITKTGENQAQVEFIKTKELGFRAAAGALFINSSIMSIGSKSHKQSYVVNYGTPDGEEQFRKIMRYKYMFEGGMKNVQVIKDEKSGTQSIALTMTGSAKNKTVDKRRARVLIPFVLKWSTGNKTERSKETDVIYYDEVECENIIFCKRKTNYRTLKAPNRPFKKETRNNAHRTRQRNGVTQGLLLYHNSVLDLSAEAKLSIINNHLKKRHYNNALKELDDYLALGRSITSSIQWPLNSQHSDSLVVSLKLTMNDQALRMLIARRDLLESYRNELLQTFTGSVKSFQSIEAQLDRLRSMLAELDDQLKLNDAADNKKMVALLRKIISIIRKNYHLLQAVEMIAPNALQAVLEFNGTYIKPMVLPIDISQTGSQKQALQ